MLDDLQALAASMAAIARLKEATDNPDEAQLLSQLLRLSEWVLSTVLDDARLLKGEMPWWTKWQDK